MLLHKPKRDGRARTRRRSAKLYESRGSQYKRRLEPVPITVDVRVFIADAAPLPNPGAVRQVPFPFADSQHEKQEKLERSFREHMERWKRDTQHWSSVTRMLAHPSYLRIVGLARQSTGNEIERLLLQELETEPDHWFDALAAITGEDPVRPEYDFDESVNAWLDWGRARG